MKLLSGVNLSCLITQVSVRVLCCARSSTLLDYALRRDLVEAELDTTLELDPAWAASATRLQTIIGIGPLTAAWLVATTLNFTICNTADELTAYAGLAPHPFQSGVSVRGRTSIRHTGNAALRTTVYLATKRSSA
jgi:transposase